MIENIQKKSFFTKFKKQNTKQPKEKKKGQIEKILDILDSFNPNSQPEITEEIKLTGYIKFEWLEKDREKVKIIGYVAYMQLLNGFEKIFYMTKDQLQAHGVKFSQTYKKGYGLWKDEFDVMAKKTVIKMLLSKYAPMTIDMQTAQLADQAIVKDDGYEYPDNEKPNHEEVSAEKENARVLEHIKKSKTVAELGA